MTLGVKVRVNHMMTGQDQMAQPHKGMRNAEIAELAQKANSVPAFQSAQDRLGLSRKLGLLCDAFVADDNDLRHALIRRMKQDGIDASDIVDYIVPETARLLGERWRADDITFADVTIGAARLQEAVHALTARQTHRARCGMGRILMVVPRPEYHTLGAFIATDQMRRIGHVVDIAVDMDPGAVVTLIQQHSYAMIGISASARRSLAYTTEMVERLRSSVRRTIPVVLGGGVLNLDLDLVGITGVTHVAADVEAALKMSGLPVVKSRSIPISEFEAT